MREPVRAVAMTAFAAVAAAVAPPLAMALAWALLSRNPLGFFEQIGASGLAAFVAGQQRFFAPVVAAGVGAHIVFCCRRRCHPLLYAGAFYLIGVVVYAVTAVPQMAAFTLDAPVVRTLLGDALLWWAPLAGLSGLVFRLIARQAPRRH